jgi:imidazolonepropionase-like amidohydrolase
MLQSRPEARLGYGYRSEQPEKRAGYEFEAKTEMLGIAPLELLKQAAVYSAEIAGIANATGSIERDKCADIILWRATRGRISM